MKLLRKVLRLIYIVPAAVGLLFLNLSKRNPKQPIPNQTPILFIHGYLYTSGGWAYIYHHLKKAGYQNLYSINLGSPFNSIGEYAKKVKQLIETINTKEIILVGHSMGGLVSIYYDQNYAELGSIKQIITLGSPLEGTSVARLGFGKCAEEMLPGSELLKNLFTHSTSTPYLLIASESDMIISPWESALFKTSHATHVKRIEFDSIGHFQLLLSKKIVDVIIAQLAINSIND